MGSCLHQHDCEEHECAGDWSLYKNIDFSGVLTYLCAFVAPRISGKIFVIGFFLNRNLHVGSASMDVHG